MVIEQKPVCNESGSNAVLDALGRQLHDLHYSPVGDAFDTDLDLRHLPSGTYWLRMLDGVGVGGVRVVKE